MVEGRLDLAGKSALVTGGAKRIGRALCLALAGQGTNVVVHYGRSHEEADHTATAIRDKGVEAAILQADLGNPAEAEGLLARAIEAVGPIDLVVCNASCYPTDRLMDFTPEQLAVNVQVNAMAPLQLARAFAAQGREGAIVNFVDARMADRDPRHTSYLLSKRMLLSITRMLALELAPAVRVNAVAPGLVLPPEGMAPDAFDRLAHTNPLHRVGSAAAVVDAVMYLLRADFVTGQVIYVDGGRRMKGSMYGS